MKRSFSSLLWQVIAAVAGIVLTAGSARAQFTTQNITLTAGWNAVWLELEPIYTTGPDTGLQKTPLDAFSLNTVTNPVTGTAIKTILSPKPLAGLADFFGTDPSGAAGGVNTFNASEWEQWKRTDPSGTNNLAMVFGNRPYLIEVTAGTATFSLTVSGKARFFRPTWTPDRYNLIGFALEGAPTFQNFFSASGGRHFDSVGVLPKIFRLIAATGAWQRVAWTDVMASRQAYWIFSAGPSNYMGPVAVDFDNSITGKLNFAGPADVVRTGTGTDALAEILELDLEELTFTNLAALATAPATPVLELTTLDPGAGSLDLYMVSPTPNSLAHKRGNQIDSNPAAVPAPAALGESIDPQKTVTLTIGALRNWTALPADRTNLYRLKTGAGTAGAMFYLPVAALKSDLQQPTDLTPLAGNAAVGLWVGEITVDAATSIVEDGEPVRPSAGSAPIRVILHSDGASAVRLLSQVTVMQTKSADPAIAPVQVLVVDSDRIPYFEGIKERNGKLVGLRIEAIAWDMPRKLDATTQAALAAKAAAQVPPVSMSDYLLSRTIRPTELVEKYQLAVTLEGALGAGRTVRTPAVTPLTLDPFHRSNPFRHAYHQNHPRGAAIARDLTIVFDADQPLADRLRGTYHETIKGLTKTNLELTGTVELRRVSSVATLEGTTP